MRLELVFHAVKAFQWTHSWPLVELDFGMRKTLLQNPDLGSQKRCQGRDTGTL